MRHVQARIDAHEKGNEMQRFQISEKEISEKPPISVMQILAAEQR
jgi:hypothetical protein